MNLAGKILVSAGPLAKFKWSSSNSRPNPLPSALCRQKKVGFATGLVQFCCPISGIVSEIKRLAVYGFINISRETTLKTAKLAPNQLNKPLLERQFGFFG